MLSRFSSLKCVTINVSKFITPRKITPVSNLLLHTTTVDCRRKKRGPRQPLPIPSQQLPAPRQPLPIPRQPSPAPGQPKVAVVLFGCGLEDGSEPFEVTFLDIMLDVFNVFADYFAPNTHNFAYNHFLGHYIYDGGATRNSQREADRLFYNKHVRDLDYLRQRDYDGLIIPGGCGFNHLEEHDRSEFLTDTIVDFNDAGKPIGTISTGAVYVAYALPNVLFTMGAHGYSYYNDWIQMALNSGMNHVDMPPGRLVRCPNYNVFSTPGYSFTSNPHTVPRVTHIPSMPVAINGIADLVEQMLPYLEP